MIKYSISIIIFIIFTKTIIRQTYIICGFNFTKSYLDRPYNKSYYKFSDTNHYACYGITQEIPEFKKQKSLNFHRVY